MAKGIDSIVIILKQIVYIMSREAYDETKLISKMCVVGPVVY